MPIYSEWQNLSSVYTLKEFFRQALMPELFEPLGNTVPIGEQYLTSRS